jgi:6-pyruvoyl-tetrahydropterin synthase
MKTTYTINRKGTIKTSLTSENQCKSVGHTSYNYEAKVEVSDKLDSSGFVIDHSEIHKAIERAFNKMTSCEKLALSCAKRIIKRCKKHGCVVLSVYVKIVPVGRDVTAFMEVNIKK